jgi:hypothetical protein
MHHMRKWLILDVVVVALFVVLGRETHGEGNALVDIARTAAPFLVALIVGWVAARAGRDPMSMQTGVIVAVVTVALGMVIRRLAFSDGTAAPFVIVASAFTLAGMLGWRAVIWLVRRRRSRVPARS